MRRRRTRVRHCSDAAVRPVAAGSSFATIPQVDVNLDANTNQIRSDFNSYVSQVAGLVSEAREKAERDIMGK